VEEYLFDSLCLICLIIEEMVEKWSLRLRLLSKFNLFKKRLSNTLFWGKVSSGFDHSSDGFGMRGSVVDHESGSRWPHF
jgi:hypothetical protein